MPGPIPTPDFARDDDGPEGLLGPPVGGVDRRVEEKTPDGGKLTREVSTKSLDVWDGTGLRKPVAETGDEMATGDGEAMCGDGAGAMAIAQRQRVLQHALHVADEPSARIIDPQQSTATQQMRETRLVSGVGKLAIKRRIGSSRPPPTKLPCLAHLLRRCRLVAADHPHATFATDVQAILQQALAARDRYQSGVISAHGLTVARGHLIARLAARLDRPSGVPNVQRFAAHLDREFTAIWSFLFDPTIDATNWRAEHAIRPVVVTRKVSGGNRSWTGTDGQQILASVVRTAAQRDLNPHVVLASMLHLRMPGVIAELN
jgi:transposase IS66 family protein